MDHRERRGVQTGTLQNLSGAPIDGAFSSILTPLRPPWFGIDQDLRFYSIREQIPTFAEPSLELFAQGTIGNALITLLSHTSDKSVRRAAPLRRYPISHDFDQSLGRDYRYSSRDQIRRL